MQVFKLLPLSHSPPLSLSPSPPYLNLKSKLV